MGEPRRDLPPVQGENAESQSLHWGKPSVCPPSWPIAAGCQDQKTQVLGATELCAVRKVISLKNNNKKTSKNNCFYLTGRADICVLSPSRGTLCPHQPLEQACSQTQPHHNQVDTREKGLRFYGVIRVPQKRVELMGFATFSAKAQKFGTITLKSIPHF